MKRIRYRSHILPITGLAVADGFFFGLTDPDRVPSLLLMVGFLLCAISMYALLRAIFAASALYGLPFHQHRRRLARVIAGTAAILLALQSIGELGSRDVVVMLPLAVMSYLYVSYGRPAPQPVRAE